MSLRRDRIETLGDSPSERSPGLDNRALGTLSSTNGKEKTAHSTTNGKNGRSNRSRSPRRDRVETLSDSPSKRPPGLDNRALGTLSSTNGKEKTAHSTTNGKRKIAHSTTNGKEKTTHSSTNGKIGWSSRFPEPAKETESRPR